MAVIVILVFKILKPKKTVKIMFFASFLNKWSKKNTFSCIVTFSSAYLNVFEQYKRSTFVSSIKRSFSTDNCKFSFYSITLFNIFPTFFDTNLDRILYRQNVTISPEKNACTYKIDSILHFFLLMRTFRDETQVQVFFNRKNTKKKTVRWKNEKKNT